MEKISLQMIDRVLKYYWFHFMMFFTSILGDTNIARRIRGFLVKPAFKKCGKKFKICSDCRIGFTNRIEIGDYVHIGNYCWIQGKGGIVLEDEVMVSSFTCLATQNHVRKNRSWRFAEEESAPIILKRGSWTGSHVVITAGVTVGEGSAVGAGAVVTKDMPADALVAGVPATVIKQL